MSRGSWLRERRLRAPTECLVCGGLIYTHVRRGRAKGKGQSEWWGPNRRIPEALKQKVRRLRQRGLGYAAIGRLLSITAKKVWEIANPEKVHRRRAKGLPRIHRGLCRKCQQAIRRQMRLSKYAPDFRQRYAMAKMRAIELAERKRLRAWEAMGARSAYGSPNNADAFGPTRARVGSASRLTVALQTSTRPQNF